jgi:hypothetical protein
MSTYALWQAYVPAKANLDESVVNPYLARALPRVDKTTAGAFYDEAVVLVAAHLHELANRPVEMKQFAGAAGVGGAIKSLKARDVSVTFGDTAQLADSMADAVLAQTVYGQQYLELAALFTAAKTPGIIF